MRIVYCKRISRSHASTRWRRLLCQNGKNKIERKVWRLQFVNRERRSDIILLDSISIILTESWYAERKWNRCDEAERIIKTATKILKGVIKNHTHQTDFYPTIDDIRDSNNDHVTDLLKLLVAEVIKSPLKQISISQALFAASKARSLMPL